MWHCALEIKTVTGFQSELFITEKNLQLAFQDVQKFLAHMRVRFAAAGIRGDSKEMRLHYSVTPSQQLHTDAGAGFKNFASIRFHQILIGFNGVMKLENVGFVITRQLA